MDREKVCCFTGHRAVSSDFAPSLIERGIRYLIDKGVYIFISGGAKGFDTLCAKAVLDLKAEFPHIQLHIYAPCNNQSSPWNEKDKQVYEDILKRADYVDMPSVPYYDGCMKVRNYKLVDSAKYCICYLVRMGSGTGQTYKYALSQGLTVFNLAGKK